RAKRLGLEGVEPPLSVRPQCHKSRFVEDSRVPRHTGLVNSRPSNKVIDLLLAMPQRFHDAAARRVSEDLKCADVRFHAYTLSCIHCRVKPHPPHPPRKRVEATLHPTGFSPSIHRRNPVSQPRTPAIRSSKGVQSPRRDLRSSVPI